MAGPDYAELLQTHAAVLFFLGDRVYKLKKPVDLGFLDFRTRADRFRVCNREVQLNRRLAPDVYLGVADILGPDQEPCDHLVVMRRMPAARRLSALVRQAEPISAELRVLARTLAVFHAAAPRGPAVSVEGSRSALLDRWDATFGQLRRFHGGVLDAAAAEEVERRTHQFLAGRDALFAERMAQNRIVDGHGDLIADDIFLLDDGPRVLDCLEFDDRLRHLDVIDDIAFLAMDLEHLGASDLAERFLADYLEFSGDPAPATLLHHYSAYRAFVRAKVGCLRHEQGDPAAAADVAAYTGLTLRHLRAGAVRLILVGGPPATGKSTLAGQLADRLGATVVSSDRVRKELAGVDPGAGSAGTYGTGIYTGKWTERTYAEMLWRARQLLERGESVVLDATWTRAEHRRCAQRLADCTHSELAQLRCAADPATISARLARRTSAELSDADARIAAAMTRAADDWPQAQVIGTDSAGSLEAAVAAVTAAPEPARTE
ncbi:AAA family ATPase [Actinoplanes sp. NPDC020271]|uniref:bifunctional aminoglycoside phosphotransferase/ATP-binding protein n=1 Tax=Actinoplanes sp. NPDC020271 TaxID=3363896 RepID=UPI0037A49C38